VRNTSEAVCTLQETSPSRSSPPLAPRSCPHVSRAQAWLKNVFVELQALIASARSTLRTSSFMLLSYVRLLDSGDQLAAVPASRLVALSKKLARAGKQALAARWGFHVVASGCSTVTACFRTREVPYASL
jgi:hypothetical protein